MSTLNVITMHQHVCTW